MNSNRHGRRVFTIADSRVVRALVVTAATLALVGGATGASLGAPATESTLLADPVIAAAGDIACDPADPSFNGGNGTATACRQKKTAALLANATAVLPLGDTQYEDGAFSKYGQSYGPSSGESWGAYRAVTRPAVGNHEYGTPGASGYFQYFGASAGAPAKGYYSFDLGSWHLVALNSEIAAGLNSAQERWLRTDLRATTKACILAYWHKPRFSSGSHGDNPSFDAFWRALYDHRADVVLNGHDHDYERFAPQNPDAAADAQGIREFVVGTGGKALRGFRQVHSANSEVRETGTYGVLKLTLRANSYEWRFVPEAGKTFSDSGSTTCHGGPTVVRPARCRVGFWAAGKGGRLRYVCLGRWRP